MSRDREQVVTIGPLGLRIPLAAGERIHTENSYKLPLAVQRRLLTEAGFAPVSTFLSEEPSYALHLARVP